jgi:hypothetical protein
MPEKHELTDIQISTLVVDEYQRGLVEPRAVRLAGKWDPAKAGVIIISKRAKGEGWFIIDGQHRVNAGARAGETTLPAILWSGLTVQREAELFYAFNNDRYAVNPVDLFRTRVIADDPIANDIVNVLSTHQVKIGHSRRGIAATAALETVFQWGYLDQTLDILLAAYPDNEKALNANPMQAIGSLFKNYGGNIERDVLVKALRERPLTVLLQAAEGMRAALGGNLWPHLATVILNEYNSGRRNKLDNYHRPLVVRGGKFNLVNPSAG